MPNNDMHTDSIEQRLDRLERIGTDLVLELQAAEAEFKESNVVRDKIGRFAKKAQGAVKQKVGPVADKARNTAKKTIRIATKIKDHMIDQEMQKIDAELLAKHRKISNDVESKRARTEELKAKGRRIPISKASIAEQAEKRAREKASKELPKLTNLINDPKAKRRMAKKRVALEVAREIALAYGVDYALKNKDRIGTKVAELKDAISSKKDLKGQVEAGIDKLEESIGINKKEKKAPEDKFVDSFKNMVKSLKTKSEDSFRLNAARVSTTLTIASNPKLRNEFVKNLKKAKTPEEMTKAMEDCLTSIDVISKGAVIGGKLQEQNQKASKAIFQKLKEYKEMDPAAQVGTAVGAGVALGVGVFLSNKIKFKPKGTASKRQGIPGRSKGVKIKRRGTPVDPKTAVVDIKAKEI